LQRTGRPEGGRMTDRRVRPLILMLLLVTSITSIFWMLDSNLNPRSALAATTPPGGSYVPISPIRIVDTRKGLGGSTLTGSQTLSVSLPTSDVPSSAIAIVANVTVTDTTASGYMTIYPSTQTRPTSSEINWSTGETVPNLVTVATGNGTIDFYNGSSGSTDVIVDLEGYYNSPSTTSGGAGHYFPLTPYRVVDTRKGTASAYAGDTLGPNSTLTVGVLGKGGLPGMGVSAIVANVTVADTTATSYLTVWPAGTTMPLASNLNWVTGQTVANRITVPVNSQGQIEFYNKFGNADVIMDVTGYYSDSTGSPTVGSLFDPVTVSRVVDTRTGLGGVTGPVSGNTINTYTLAGQGGIPATSSPNPADSVVVNLTEAYSSSAGGYLTVYPDGDAPPISSDLNFNPGEVKANMDVASLSSNGTLEVYNAIGSTQYIIDVLGYFTPAAPNDDIVTVSPNPTSVVADGSSTSTVTVTDVTSAGKPVSQVLGGSVVLSVTGTASTPGACGSFPSSVVITSPNASTTFTYTASSVVGTCLLSVSEQVWLGPTPGIGTAVITQSPQTYVVWVTQSSTNVVANGTSQVTLEICVNTGGTSCGYSTVNGTATLTTSANPSGACGSLSPTSVSIVVGAIAMVTYTSSTVLGICDITATFNSSSTTVAIAQSTVAPSSTYSVTSTVPTTVVAGNTVGYFGYVTVKNANNLPVSGDLVSVFSNGGSVCGNIKTTSNTTDPLGQIGIYYYPSDFAGTCQIVVTEAQTGGQDVININQSTALATVTVTASPDAINASTTSVTNQTTVQVSVDNINGPLANDSLSIATSGPTGVCGSIASSATTNEAGIATLTYSAGQTAGSCVINVTEADTSQSGNIAIAQATSASTSLNKVSITPGSSSATVNSSVTLTVTVVSPAGNPVSGDSVGLSVVGGPQCGNFGDASTVSTNSAGQATVTYSTGATPQTCGIKAVESGTGAIGLASVSQSEPVGKISVEFNGASSSLPVAEIQSGQNNLSFVVTVTDALGGPVVSDTVKLTPIGLTSNACGSSNFAQTSGATNYAGQFETTFNTGAVGFCAVLISDSKLGLNNNFLIVETNALANSSEYTTLLVAQPDELQADGTSTSQLRMLVTNSSYVPIANDPVVFISPKLISSSFASCGVIQNSFFGTGIEVAQTNSDGVTYLPSQATPSNPYPPAKYQASTTAGSCPVFAIEAESGNLTGVAIVQSVSAPTTPTLTITSSVPTIYAGGTTTAVTLTVTNNGAGFEGDQFSLQSESASNQGACGDLVNYLPVSNSSGNVAYQYRPGNASGFCVVGLKDSYGNAYELVIDQMVPGATAGSYKVQATIDSTNNTLTVNVDNANGVGVANDPLLFSVGGGSSCAGSGPSSDYGVTGSSPLGQYQTTITPPPSGAMCVLNVQEANTGSTTQVSLP